MHRPMTHVTHPKSDPFNPLTIDPLPAQLWAN